MPFVKYENGLFTKNESRKTLYMPMVFSLALCVLVMIINLVSFPKKEIGHSWLENSGGVFDLVQLLILNFILWSFNRLTVKASLRRWINLGLFIWIMSAAFDLMDEFIHQPLWVGYYIEDVSRLTGMLCVSMGIYFIVRYVNDQYADASIDSYRDELTHLPNRRYFRNIFLELNTTNIYVFIIDVDFFKKINDKYGHDIGDEVLRDFANLLSSLYDGNVTASRIGGEEFAVILQLPSKQEANVVAEKILSRTRDLVIRGEIRFTVSIGAGHKKEDETVENLLKRVDVALYDAKCRGKNRIEWADG
ncbi:GGDEF domain-containing protein [Rahnella sp. PCH160]|uniref:GGDEF domain-containing protein n=1 Tax=Rahnella sp. PCH160 TaxID=3447928 RepID=UPI0039FC2EC8